MQPQPDFERFRTTLLRKGEPDRVPQGDISVHPILKQAVLGRTVRTLEDEVAFWGGPALITSPRNRDCSWPM